MKPELRDFFEVVAGASDDLILDFCEYTGESVDRFTAFRRFSQIAIGRRDIEASPFDQAITNQE